MNASFYELTVTYEEVWLITRQTKIELRIPIKPVYYTKFFAAGLMNHEQYKCNFEKL